MDSFDPREEPFGFVSPVISRQDSKVLVKSRLELSPQLAVAKMGGSSTEADVELLNALCPGLELFFSRVKPATKYLCYESMFPVQVKPAFSQRGKKVSEREGLEC